MINKKTVYNYRGKQYNNPETIQTDIENLLGKEIDNVDQLAGFMLSPKVKLQFLELLTDKARSTKLIALMEEFQEAQHYIDGNDE